MRFKLVFSLCVVHLAFVFCQPIDHDDKVTDKEQHCLNLCTKFEGEPFFDKYAEKCYCSIRKEHILLNKENKEAMRMNAKIHDLNLIIQEFREVSNRVRREDTETPTEEPPVVVPEEDNNEDPIVESEPPSVDTETESPIVAAVHEEDKKENEIPSTNEKRRPLTKVAGARRTAPKPDLDELLHNAQNQMESVFQARQAGQPKEAHSRIKEIQSALNQIAARLKYEDQASTFQERVSRQRDEIPMIVEPSNVEETAVEGDESILAKRRGLHKHRIPKLRSNEKKDEAEEEKRHRISPLQRRGQRQRLGTVKTGHADPEPEPIAAVVATDDVAVPPVVENEIETAQVATD